MFQVQMKDASDGHGNILYSFLECNMCGARCPPAVGDSKPNREREVQFRSQHLPMRDCR